MKLIINMSIIALTLFPFGCLSAKNKSEGITVMSYNIRCGTANDGTNSWDFRKGESVLMIQDQKPDVIGLQEANKKQVDFLEYFLDDYKSVGVGREDGKNKGEMMRIFYNKKTTSLLKWGTFWLSETPDVPAKGWDAACIRTATWALMKDKASGRKYYFIDTHIDHKGKIAQEEGVKLLISKMAEINTQKLNMVIVGDFNMKPENKSIILMGTKVKNARTTAAITDDSGTFHGWGKESELIDYIWYDGFRSCSEYQVITKKYSDVRNFVSDHYPIKATIFF